MAAIFRHGVSVSKTSQVLSSKNILFKCYATKSQKRKGSDRKPTPKLDSTTESIAAKGFLRAQREYVPPQDMEYTLSRIFKDVLGKTESPFRVTDLTDRFRLFKACLDKFGHSIPNSLLHQIESLEDVIKFYASPVNTRTPLDRMRSMELPENLHVQFEYHRWNSDTDTMFGGQTAFPESSTILTGLKYKRKYKGHVQKISHPEL